MIIHQKNHRFGFTLIELLAVIAIVGILIAMIVGISSLANRKSSDGKVRSEMQLISNALEEYRALYGSYPDSISDMVSPTSRLSPEFKSVPTKDPWGQEYYYTKSANHRYEFSLRSIGSDRIANTKDDIVSGTF